VLGNFEPIVIVLPSSSFPNNFLGLGFHPTPGSVAFIVALPRLFVTYFLQSILYDCNQISEFES
jgi:hypothetical protein